MFSKKFQFLLTAPSAPQNLIAVSKNSTSVLIEWSEPVSLNGILVTYKIEYEMQSNSFIRMTNFSKLKYLMEGLRPYSNYTIRVCGVTGELGLLQFGPFSNFVVVTTDESSKWNIYG